MALPRNIFIGELPYARILVIVPEFLCSKLTSGTPTSWKTGRNQRGWGNSHPALTFPRDVWSPHCSFTFTQMTVPLGTPVLSDTQLLIPPPSLCLNTVAAMEMFRFRQSFLKKPNREYSSCLSWESCDWSYYFNWTQLWCLLGVCFSLATKQEQATTESPKWWKYHWHQPTYPPRLVHQQQTWLQTPLTLVLNYLTPPFWQVLRVKGLRGTVYTIPHPPSPLIFSTITAHAHRCTMPLLPFPVENLITVSHNNTFWWKSVCPISHAK